MPGRSDIFNARFWGPPQTFKVSGQDSFLRFDAFRPGLTKTGNNANKAISGGHGGPSQDRYSCPSPASTFVSQTAQNIALLLQIYKYISYANTDENIANLMHGKVNRIDEQFSNIKASTKISKILSAVLMEAKQQRGISKEKLQTHQAAKPPPAGQAAPSQARCAAPKWP